MSVRIATGGLVFPHLPNLYPLFAGGPLAMELQLDYDITDHTEAPGFHLASASLRQDQC